MTLPIGWIILVVVGVSVSFIFGYSLGYEHGNRDAHRGDKRWG